jgi:hypothetical protein
VLRPEARFAPCKRRDSAVRQEHARLSGGLSEFGADLFTP